jgi:uncharacterized protein (DUF433 family)
MTLSDFLTQDDHGYIHVTGHRVGLSDLVFFYGQGDSPEMLHARFPTISLPLCHKIIAFYLENQPAVDEYCATQAEEIARQRAASRPGPSLEELRQRRSEKERKRGRNSILESNCVLLLPSSFRRLGPTLVPLSERMVGQRLDRGGINDAAFFVYGVVNR